MSQSQSQDPEVIDLLQQLIRNRCVNDGSDASGHEARNAELLAGLVARSGADIERYEPTPGRASVVARIEGTDPDAPSLCYLGHTDVVPANEDTWSRDPFGGDLVDGEVWGRGAIDMLNLTASMSLAFARLARAGWRPRGTLVLAAVADEEALGSHGAGWLVEHAPDAVATDYLLTETGGMPLAGPGGKLLPVPVAEKGSCWCRLRVHGEAGHASMPFRTDNALVTAAEVVRRLARHRPVAEIHDSWRALVEAMGWPPEVTAALLDPERVDGALDELAAADLVLVREAHACTHTTIAPTIVHGGSKINTIPDRVDLDVDIRTLPGWGPQEVRAMIADALGDLAPRVEIVDALDDPATASRFDTPLWDRLAALAARFHPDGRLVPTLQVGATDARFFRRRGTVSYGFGMFSDRIGYDRFGAMFHGDDERIDVDSLAWSAAAFEQLARDFLGG
jgi:acetylornithine deacetylase/succinyl-diaminopimelate desuccinylase-like protein